MEPARSSQSVIADPSAPCWYTGKPEGTAEAETEGGEAEGGEEAMSVLSTARLTCPLCGHVAEEQMPTDYCLHFYECRGCQAVLKPKAGDCCVFCSYADAPCPPMQESGRGL